LLYDSIYHMIHFDEEETNRRIKELRSHEEEKLAEHLSAQYGLPFTDLQTTPVNIGALRVIPEEEARDAKVGVFDITNKKVKIAVFSPEHPKTKAVLENLKKRDFVPVVYMTSSSGLEKIWSFYKDLSFTSKTTGGSFDISSDEIEKFLTVEHTLDEIKERITTVISNKGNASKLLEVVLSGAMGLGASDIHLEPEEESARLRYRLDGVLTDIAQIENKTYARMLSRVLLLSNLKLNLGSEAQDGRFSIKIGEKEIEIRTSIVPASESSTIVLRILDPKGISVPLESLGIHPRLLELLIKEIEKPNGMLLTTGPTGSGKTTTLYAFLKKIYSPGIKILTIENPVEYHLKGIVQTQIDTDRGYTFLNGLRAALRQDPDVIMVGEIRDNETAEISVDAALTGHIVFSTLHTNNAAGTFPRLIDLGVNPKTLISALTVSMAQRLLRKLHPERRKEVPIEGKDKETIDRILASIDDKSYLEGLQTTSMWVPQDGLPETDVYKGRVGVYEAILMDEAVQQAVLQSPSERDIVNAAHPQNILNMEQDGIIKILQGVTTLDELRRVVDLKE